MVHGGDNPRGNHAVKSSTEKLSRRGFLHSVLNSLQSITRWNSSTEYGVYRSGFLSVAGTECVPYRTPYTRTQREHKNGRKQVAGHHTVIQRPWSARNKEPTDLHHEAIPWPTLFGCRHTKLFLASRVGCGSRMTGLIWQRFFRRALDNGLGE